MELRIAVTTLLLLPLLTCLSGSDAALATMSIDLGSQFMKMALVKPGVPMEIVLNKESRRKTPNLVTIKDGERLFGDEALAKSLKFPQFAFGHLVSLLGQQSDSPIVAQFKERFPFLNMTEDEERHTVQFVNNGETYSVESLIAMVLSHARREVESYAEQPVRDAIITVPAYLNQAERRALVTAAEIADINLLQLLNEHSAAGLNYGVFRRKEITEQSKTMLIYDMGASKTTAAIVSYQIEKEKDSNEKNPQMRTVGFGYDRTLGGFEITHRLREFLVEAFRKQVKTRVDIRKTPRSMAKMLKEAERLKQVLSANADHFAQIENVHEEHDFRLKVHRSELEEMMVDLLPRMLQPIKDALKMAEMDLKQIDQVVLMGAGTRTPKVKAVLQEFLKGKELGNFLNTDEAIAMGAVYQAAHLSKGFKVLKFGVHDLHIFPIQVDFMSHTVKEGEQTKRMVHRPIFSYKSFYPSNRKILSFTSYDEDFGFNINYGELKHLNAKQLSEFGSKSVSDIEMTGIAEAVKAQMADKGTVMKGVKVRFSIDGSGIVHLEGATAIFEKAHKEESAFASIAGKFANLFSSGDEAGKDKETDEDLSKEEKLDSNKVDETPQKEEKKPEKQEGDQTDEEKKDEGKSGETKEKEKETEKSKEGEKTTPEDVANKSKTEESAKNKKEEPKEVKPATVKVELKLTKTERDVISLLDADLKSTKKILRTFDQREEAKVKRDEAQNKLEERVYDVSDKLEQPEFQKFITESEKSAVEEKLKEARTWLEDDVDLETTYEQFESKHQVIRDLLKPVNARFKYHKERPLIVTDLLSLFNHTEMFLGLSENLTAAEVFSEVEVTTLSKLFTETKAWWTEKNATQQALSPIDEPAYTISELKEKFRDLDREVKYLLNKMKFAKPKVEPKEATKGNDTANANETESASESAAEEIEGGSSEPKKESSDETGEDEKKKTKDSGEEKSTGKEKVKTGEKKEKEENQETAEDTTHTAEL